MTARVENPYRAAGTFEGVSYIERDADAQLVKEVRENRLYPYFLSPRQSGKSSLISRTMQRLQGEYQCAFLDLSTYPPDSLENYDLFLTTFGEELLFSLGVADEIRAGSDLKRIVKEVAARSARRVIIFVDEVDQLLTAKFNDAFFGLVRFFFNQRARDPEMKKVQFVLAGAASPTQLISKENQSPFNVGKSIKLEDLSESQVGVMLSHLWDEKHDVKGEVRARVFHYTRGAVYLTQLILERLWDMCAHRQPLNVTTEDVERVVKDVIAESPDNVHFLNIYSGIASRREVLQGFRYFSEGEPITPAALEYLRITGITVADGTYRNPIYEAVFGPGGPLSLFHDARQAIAWAEKDRRKTLDLEGQSLTTLSPKIGNLANLETLNLRGNQISTLPPEIWRLRNLRHLDLSHNQLTTLPAEISQLVKLETLNLRGNQLTSIPPQLADLQRLSRLDLRDNPLPVPPKEVASVDSPGVILNYYFQLIGSPQRKPLNEAKVLVVGQGSVGKTSLIKRLTDNSFDPDSAVTEGIKIRKLYWDVNDKWIRLNIWDFGGQEIFHATHQFFLTKRSLYLLVIDARLSEEDSRLEYWLKLISGFGQDSPIIIVGNKIDQHKLDLDRRGLRAKYPNIKAFVETSCLTGEGIDALSTSIKDAVATLGFINDFVPASWLSVKERLEQLRQDYITYADYVLLCRQENLDDEATQRQLQSFLHDLGVVLNFSDDPSLEDTTILNPDWVTQGVYQILNSQVLSQNKGVLYREDLRQILDETRYPPDKHLFIINMMRKFELCFDFGGQRDEKFLIPELLSREEPFTGGWGGALNFQYHYNVLPGSVISRLIVRMHQYISRDLMWRTGVVVEEGKCRALVRADFEDRKIVILVKGPSKARGEFLALIRSQLESIHHTIPGLVADERVQLPSNPEVDVNYTHLQRLEQNNIHMWIPEGLTRQIKVRSLLDAVEPARLRRERYTGRVLENLTEAVARWDRLWRNNLLSGHPIPRNISVNIAPKRSSDLPTIEGTGVAKVEVLLNSDLYGSPEESVEDAENFEPRAITPPFEFNIFPRTITLTHFPHTATSRKTLHRLRKPNLAEWQEWGRNIKCTRRYLSPAEIAEDGADDGDDEEKEVWETFYGEWEASEQLYDKIILELAGVKLDKKDDFPTDQFRQLAPEIIAKVPFEFKEKVITGLYECWCSLESHVSSDDAEQRVYQNLSHKSTSYDVIHTLRKPSCEESHAFRTNIVKGYFSTNEDNQEIIQLKLNLSTAVEFYDGLLINIENATVDGKPFSNETRKAFLESINPIYKLRILEPLFDVNAWYFKIDEIRIP